jgi:putative peptidoglycan lipid II flippase
MPSTARLVSSVRLIAAFTLLSRVLGLARESVFGYLFGAGAAISAFRIAFMVPNLARRLFGEGALSLSVIPVLTDVLRNDGAVAARRLVGGVVTMLIGLLTALVVVAEIGLVIARWWRPDHALDLTITLLPYMILICVAALLGGVLNVLGRFGVPAFAPVLLNVAIIVAAWIASRGMGLSDRAAMMTVSLAVLGAGVAQLLLVLAALRRVGFVPVPALDWGDARVARIIRLMAPMVLGLSVVQINSLTDYLIAYVVVTVDGVRIGPAVLGYAQYVYQLPLGVFGIALATAIFPVLAECKAAGDRQRLAAVFTRGLKLSMFIALPACAGLLVVADVLVSALFERGAFGPSDTVRVSGTLMCYSLGMAAYFSQHVVVRTFYALEDSRTPSRVAMVIVVLNLSLNLALVFRFEERGLATATAVTAFVQVSWLLRRLRPLLPEVDWRSIGRSVFQAAIACLAMTAALVALRHPAIAEGLLGGRPIPRLAVMVPLGVGVFAGAARLMRMEELGALVGRARVDAGGHSDPPDAVL